MKIRFWLLALICCVLAAGAVLWSGGLRPVTSAPIEAPRPGSLFAYGETLNVAGIHTSGTQEAYPLDVLVGFVLLDFEPGAPNSASVYLQFSDDRRRWSADPTGVIATGVITDTGVDIVKELKYGRYFRLAVELQTSGPITVTALGTRSRATPTPVLTATSMPTLSETEAPPEPATDTPTPTNTPLPTNTPPGNTATFTPTPTQTPLPTSTATFVPTSTNTPTFTNTPTNTPGSTSTNTPAPTATPTNTPGASLIGWTGSSGAVQGLPYPAAQGYARNTRGGGAIGQTTVYLVTNLNDSGAGSLRACVETNGPRICVFRLGGTIELHTALRVGTNTMTQAQLDARAHLTIAGQTTPNNSGGITLKASSQNTDGLIRISTYDVAISHIRLRSGVGGTGVGCPTDPQCVYGDAMTAIKTGNRDKVYNVMLDHLSCSWAVDTCLELGLGAWNTTVQYSLIAEMLDNSTHSYTLDPTSSGYPQGHSRPVLYFEDTGGPLTTGYASFLHNIVATNHHRFPEIHTVTGRPVDVVNNVLYNWGGGPNTTGYRKHVINASVRLGNPSVNFIGNYFKKGPESVFTVSERNRFSANKQAGQPGTVVNVYLSNNIDTLLGAIATVVPEDAGVTVNYGIIPYGPAHYEIDTPADAYTELTAIGGAGNSLYRGCNGGWFARRDSADMRIIADVVAGDDGELIDSPTEVGGWPALAAGTPCNDTDSDGMPNGWETQVGSNPNVNDANLDFGGTGWTRVEAYIWGIGE